MNAAAVTIPMEDAEIVARCRDGDRTAFGHLVVKYQDRVFNLCRRLCGSREDAADLTQEAFLKALSSLERFGDRAGFYTWLFRIAVNLSIDRRRRKSRATMVSLDVPEETDGPGWGRRVAVDGPPDRLASARERRALIESALASLDDEHQTVVVLRDVEGFDYDEIARILDVPIGTVKSRLYRARMTLRAKLRPLMETAQT